MKTFGQSSGPMVNTFGGLKEQQSKVALPIRNLKVNVFLVDTRGGATNVQQYFGIMKMPLMLLGMGETVNWRFDELKEPLKGLTMDGETDEISIVFSCMDKKQARNFEVKNRMEEGTFAYNFPVCAKTGKPIMFEDLKTMLKMYDPSLALIIGGRSQS